MKNQIRGSLYLTIAALVWGMAFAAQSTAMDHVGPFAFTAARSLISCAVLAVFLPMLRKFPGMADGAPRAAYIKLGLPLGAILFAAVALQQAGLMSTSSAKSGFITALYIVIVPILGMFLGRRVRANVWVSVVLALAGLCLLTLKEDFSIQSGDLLTLGCAIVFSFHILAVDRYAGGLNAAKLCCIQFGVTGVLALLATILFEHADFSGLSGCMTSLLYVGVCSGALGYTLQIAGQRHTDPTLASLLMCLESVFAAVGGWLILKEALSPREFSGCALMLIGCVLAQLPGRRRRRGMPRDDIA